ncbi:UNKNOWN [Stylonychia lemnae]|uniref:Endoplasmic reticulum transmembrane protein n=1 Tax=Stylonychia lemnae TaxID=5949 RepID=A0A077ZZ68_STYLE|nr:UNKNOWN [Stylonychia lemnae]|eukprot:CDW75246.1 UNKNOWN [Stylonychia lemnae]
MSEGHHHQHVEIEHTEGPLSFLIPEGLDAFSAVFIILIVFSALYEIIYLISPKKIKIWLEGIDQAEPKEPKDTRSFQMSTMVATLFGMLSLLFLWQTQNYKLEDQHDAFRETAEQRQFRHRQLWTIQSYKYQCFISMTIWLGIKILMSINRKHREVEAELQALFKEKDPQDKKND